MDYSEECPHCHSRIVAYSHNLNAPLVMAFCKLVEFYMENGRACNVNKELGLDHNQLANFQKLRYFGIVENLGQGEWFPTRLGLAFYQGEETVQNPAGSFNNEALAMTHPAWQTHKGRVGQIFISEILQDWPYKKRPEYQAEASSQMKIF